MRTYDGPAAALTLCCVAVLSLSPWPTDASGFHRRPTGATVAVGRRHYDETTAEHRGPPASEDDEVTDDVASGYVFADRTGDEDDRAASGWRERPGRTKADVDRRRYDETTAARRAPSVSEYDEDEEETEDSASHYDFADGTGDDDDDDDDDWAYDDRAGNDGKRDRGVPYVDDKAKRGAVLDNINDYYRERYGKKPQRLPPYPLRAAAAAYAGNGLSVDTSMLRGETVELPTYVNVPVTLRCKFVPVDGSDNKFETVVEAMRPGHGTPKAEQEEGEKEDSHASRALDQLVGSIDGWREVVKTARPVRRAVVDRFAGLADRLHSDPLPVRTQHRRHGPDDRHRITRPSDDGYSARSSPSDEEYSTPSRRFVERQHAVAAAAATSSRLRHRHHDGGLLQTAALQRAAERLQKYRDARQWVTAKSRHGAATVDEDRPVEKWRQPEREQQENQLVGEQVDDQQQSSVVDDRQAEDLDGQKVDGQQQVYGQRDDDQRQFYDQQDDRSQQANGQQVDDRSQKSYGQQDDGGQRQFYDQQDDRSQHVNARQDDRQTYGRQDDQQTYGQQDDQQTYGQQDEQQTYGRQDDQQAVGQQVDDRSQQSYGQQDDGQRQSYERQDDQLAYGQQADLQQSYGPFGAEDPSVGQDEAGVTVERVSDVVDDPPAQEEVLDGGSHEITAIVAGPYSTVFGEAEQQPVSTFEDQPVPTDSA